MMTDQFLVEPFVRHEQDQEYYICINSVRDVSAIFSFVFVVVLKTGQVVREGSPEQCLVGRMTGRPKLCMQFVAGDALYVPEASRAGTFPCGVFVSGFCRQLADERMPPRSGGRPPAQSPTTNPTTGNFISYRVLLLPHGRLHTDRH